MRTRLTAYLSSRRTAPETGAGDREPRVAEPASTLPGESKRLAHTDADWHAMRLRSEGGRHEHAGADHRNDGRFKAWGTVALFRYELAPLAGEQVGVVEDAGPGGLFIAIPQPPPVGTLLRLRIYSQAGPQGVSVVEASGRITRCQLHEPRGAAVQILDFADGEQGQAAWLALVRQPFPNVALMPPPPVRAPLAPGKDRQQWKTRSRR